jgi:hypothetical protein
MNIEFRLGDRGFNLPPQPGLLKIIENYNKFGVCNPNLILNLPKSKKWAQARKSLLNIFQQNKIVNATLKTNDTTMCFQFSVALKNKVPIVCDFLDTKKQERLFAIILQGEVRITTDRLYIIHDFVK